MKEEKQLTQSARDYAVYVGDVALDEYYRTPRWPSVADKVEVQTLEAIPGGMIANAACVYAALGNQVGNRLWAATGPCWKHPAWMFP